MKERPSSQPISPKLRRIAELARTAPDMVFTTLNPALTLELLAYAASAVRQDGAVGIDGMTAEQYQENLWENLRDLLDRAKSGRYQAPAVRRVYIPKGKGKTRPIGIPTYEDKILQRAVAWILEAVYEQDFAEFSFGFRPGRSAHQAIEAADKHLWAMGGGWVQEVDIKGFFDAVGHEHLRAILGKRINDGVILRLIGKWLNAGVFENGVITRPGRGTPQGGVISPVLANIYLNEVFDRWFVEAVQPRMKGRCFALRYADDIVIGFQKESDARRVQDVLAKRFGKYGLELHPEKTQLVDFRRPSSVGPKDGPRSKGPRPGTFDLLGFTFYWGRSRRGQPTVKRKTARDRLRRAIAGVWRWAKRNRHLPVPSQHKTLSQKLRGHYAYYGITHNFHALRVFYERVQRAWWYWLQRRSQRGRFSWETFRGGVLGRHPLPPPRIVHSFAR